MHYILDVTYDEDRCKLLTQRVQKNRNIFRKTGVSVHKKYLKEKSKQLNQICSTACLTINCFWKLLKILQFVIFHEIFLNIKIKI